MKRFSIDLLSNNVGLVSLLLQIFGHQGEVGEETARFLRPEDAVL